VVLRLSCADDKLGVACVFSSFSLLSIDRIDRPASGKPSLSRSKRRESSVGQGLLCKVKSKMLTRADLTTWFSVKSSGKPSMVHFFFTS